MTNHEERYANGKLKASQQKATRDYRQRQAELRGWADDLAQSLGMSRQDLTKTSAAEIVSRLLQEHDPPEKT